MKAKSIFHYTYILCTALLLWQCSKSPLEPKIEDFKVKSFISHIKSYSVNADYIDNAIPTDNTSTVKPYVAVQSWVIKGKDILMSITVPDDAVELYFGAINSQTEYMGLNFSGQNQATVIGYYRLKLNNLRKVNTVSNGLQNYQVVLSSNENIQLNKFDLVVGCKTAKGISNTTSVPVDVISIAPYQKILKLGFRPLSGYTYTIKITTPTGGQITYSYNKNTGTETFNTSESANSTLSYDSGLDFKWIDFSDPQFGRYTMTATIQIDLSQGSQYIYLLLAIITEGKIDQVDLNANIQQTGPNTAVGTANVSFNYFEELEAKIVVTKIWSDQFENKNFNFLSGGAGKDGNISNRILMGTRGNSYAYAKAIIKVTPTNNSHSNIQVRFAYLENSKLTLLGDGFLNGSEATVWFNSNAIEEIPSEYSIVAWFDDNGNNELDGEEQYSLSDGKFAIVNNNTYSTTLGELINLTNLSFWTFSVPRSRAFFRAFLLNEPIEYGGTYLASNINFHAIEEELQQSLSYNVGVNLNYSSSAVIKSYFFGSNSLLAEDVMNSEAFRKLILSILDANRDIVTQSYPNDKSFSWSLPNTIEFLLNAEQGSLDFDFSRLFHIAYLYGNITINVACNSGRIVLTSIEISGTVKDLYDFNYSNTPPLQYGHKAALVQAGYGTIGNGGGIFRIEVNLNKTITNFTYDFGGC